MSQQPGSGSGPYGPQGQNPYGQQPGQNPPQNPPQNPYGSPPASQTPAYGQQPPQAPQQPPYGQPQQPPYGQQPPQAPAYGPTSSPQAPAYPPAPQQPTPGYGTSAPSATPVSGTPPYGSSPTPPPAYGSGTPSSYGSPTPPPATPSYGAAPSSGPQPYGSSPPPQAPAYGPGQPAQGWSGDARAPQAYSPVPGAFPPAPPKKKSRAGLVIGVVAAVLVLLVGGGYLVSQALMKPEADPPIATPTAPISEATSASASASATSTASGFPGFAQSGSTLSGSNFTTTLPVGWVLSPSNGGKNEGEIVDKNRNLVVYYTNYQRKATENCAYLAAGIASLTGVETAQPAVPVSGVTWAGEAATGVEVTFKRASQTQQEVIGYYCIDHAGGSILLRSLAWESDQASVQAGAKQLLASWKWN